MSNEERTNEDRARLAHSALTEYVTDDGRWNHIHDFDALLACVDPGDTELDDDSWVAEALGDLLCDLQHMADALNLDWRARLHSGTVGHAEEVAEERQRLA